MGKKLRFLEVVAVALGVLAAASEAQAAGKNLRVAVYDFDQKGTKSNGALPAELGKKAVLRLTSDLVSGGAQIDIISRDQIERILKEQNLQFSDLYDADGAVKVGKLLTADAIITGSIDGQVTSSDVRVMGIGYTNYTATVGGTAQLVSIATGKVLAAPSVREKDTERAKASLGGNSTADSGGSDRAADKALDKVCASLAQQIASRLGEIPTSAPGAQTTEVPKQQPTPGPKTSPTPAPPTDTYVALPGEIGPVIMVQDSVVTFGLGTGTHRPGEVVQIKRVKMVPDPRNGKLLPISETIGTLTLIEISDSTGSGKYTGQQTPQTGDRVVPKPHQ